MFLLSDYLSFIPPEITLLNPWTIPTQLPVVISKLIKTLSEEYIISDGNAIHHTAIIETGAIIANYRNERMDKEIICFLEQKKILTGVDKFGAILGDGCKIGANAVLAPGTILKPETIVGRLTLIDDHK